MAIQAFPQAQVWASYNGFGGAIGTTNATINAAGESAATLGTVILSAGRGSSKTISAGGGGKIWIRTVTVGTFASGSTNLSVGVQDIAATGLEDGTFDVKADVVGGTTTFPAQTWKQITMTSGTKTLAYGDEVAIVVEMTARGGTDSVVLATAQIVPYVGFSAMFPYSTADVGAGPVRGFAPILCFLVFDDGTLGWILAEPEPDIAASPNSLVYNNTSSPDEYAAVFTFPFGLELDGFIVGQSNMTATGLYEMVLYSDPLGSPAVIETVTPVDVDRIGGTSNSGTRLFRLATARTLSANVTYGIAMRPTAAVNVGLLYWNLADSNIGWTSVMKALFPFGTMAKVAGRTNQTGAFTETNTAYYPVVGLFVNGIEIPSGGSGGAYAFAG